MSIPKFAFLDTSVLDSQQYNFKSAALSTFVPVCKQKSVKLLLPEPTEREIRRHIRERSKEALDALEEARRKAPFLSKWRGLTEVLLSDDARVEKLRTAIENKVDLLIETIIDELPGLHYYHTNEIFEIGDMDYDEVDFDDLSIVAIGDNECTVAFEASVKISADLRWQDVGDEEYGPRDERTTVRERIRLSGTAKIAFDNTASEVSGVSCVTLDSNEFAITKNPFEGPR